MPIKMKKHPGIVEFYKLDNEIEKLVKKQEIEKIPEQMRYVEIDGKMIPVVKIVRLKNPSFIEIKEYEPNQQFLRSTIARN